MNTRPEFDDAERALGLFLNTVPMRIRLAGGTWTNLAQQAFAAEVEALPYRRYPTAELQKSKGGLPLFEAAFNFTHFHVYEGLQSFDDIEVIGGDGVAETNFELLANFDWNVASSELRLSLHANAGEFTAAQTEAFAGYYARALAAMAQEPEARYELASLLSEEELSL